MQMLFLISRIILGLYFLDNASHHFFQLNMISGFAESRGVPAPKVAVLIGGMLLFLGGLSILTGYKPVLGIISLILFLLPVTLQIHTFWKFQDQMVRMNERINFTKNFALMSCIIMLLTIPRPWPFSI